MTLYLVAYEADGHFAKSKDPLAKENYLRKIFTTKKGMDNFMGLMYGYFQIIAAEELRYKCSPSSLMMQELVTKVYKHALKKAKGNAAETAKVRKIFASVKRIIAKS